MRCLPLNFASFDRVSVLLDSVTPIELTRQRLKLDLIGDV